MIEDLHFEQLTEKEKQELPNQLTALPPLRFNHLKGELNHHHHQSNPSKSILTLY